jgi:acyl-CoA synthetase (AMP-forming)/AMP-acid ligase II
MKLGNVLADIARRYPDDVAVVCEDRRLTFGQLDARANRIANGLAARGIAAGDRVVVYLPNGIAAAELLPALLKLPVLIVPVSTRLAASELAHIVTDSAPRAVVYDAEHRAAARAALGEGMIAICIDDRQPGETALEELAQQGAASPPPPLPPEPDDCLIAYTSGTTGKPKGAVSTHLNIIFAHAFLNANEWGLTHDDVIFAGSPLAHRTGLGRLANAFFLGCKLVLQPRFDPADAVRLIEREKVTVLGGVPTIVRLMMPAIEANPAALASLRLVVATGEVFPVPLKERLFAALPQVGLYSFLAQTEAGVVTGLLPEEQRLRPDSAGRAVPGVEIRLVDPELRDVPAGTPGEILVRCGLPGRCTVIREYFRNPQATAEAFVDGWLRTGDVAYADDDGYYYFVDRAKDMIVSGGLNIYSKEVEIALLAHPAVEDAAVFGVPDAAFGEAVMACVQLRRGRSATADDLVAHCRDRIASYKKPKYVRFVDDLPRTASGKVQKHELKRLFVEDGATVR